MPRPSIEPFEPRELGPKPWGTELLIAHTEHYLGKALFMTAGSGGNLQYHERKVETFFLASGKAMVTWEKDGEQFTDVMEPGQAYHVPAGAIHAVKALDDCVFFEASTPVFEDRVVVEERS